MKEDLHRESLSIVEVARLRAFAKDMQVHKSLYELEAFGFNRWLGALLVYIQILNVLDMYGNYKCK